MVKKITKKQNTETSLSAALVGSNDDLLFEFFLRLPVTSVIRFKSVSKHWQSLLSHRSFTLQYKSIPISLGVFADNLLYIPFDDEKRSSPPFRALDFYPDPCGIRILQSCNGLLLCCSDVEPAESDCNYYVFNPTTKQFALIPSVPGAGDVTIYGMGLAFHQTDCAHYKVVCIVTGDERLYQTQTYSSDTGRWKISPQSLDQFYEFCSGVYCNQAIYWSQHDCYFNLITEKLQLMPIVPKGLSSYTDRQGHFGESRGHLHLAVHPDESDRHIHVKVYEMLNDHSGWFLKYRVELHDLLNAYPEINRRTWYDYQVLDVVRGEEEDETFMVIRIPDKVIRYNVARKTFKQIYDLSTLTKCDRELILNEKLHRYIATIDSF